jgi:hypothetical protein
LLKDKLVEESKELAVEIDINNTTDDVVYNTFEDIQNSLDEDLNLKFQFELSKD